MYVPPDSPERPPPPGDDEAPVVIPIERELDLHAFRPRDVVAVVEAFIDAAHAAGLPDVRLVHGRGTGVQRGLVHAVLERHPLVASFADDPRSHLGATFAMLVRREAATPPRE